MYFRHECDFIKYIFVTIYHWMFQGTFIKTDLKVYFYGEYKFTFKFKNEENKIHRCFVVDETLVRP